MEIAARVRVKNGRLQGKICTSYNSKTYYTFSGIPYAEPPIGELRFKDPVPKSNWDGLKDSTIEGGVAAQFNYDDSNVCQCIGSDDCLYLNVYTPKLELLHNKLLPVMVQIHGGAFISGSQNIYDFGPEYITEKNVILVTVGYRLGVMGFLCTDAVNAKGDMGLKDQNLALKWVNENIHAFGGNPNNVTIFGGSSVDYHVLSPKSGGLFKRAIIQSGSAMNPWARIMNPIEMAERLAKCFNYDGSEHLFEFINNISTEELVKASSTLITKDDLRVGNLLAFNPVINFFPEYDGFLNEEPSEILKNGKFNKVSVISGYCDMEGMMMRQYYHDENIRKDFNNCRFYDYVPPTLNKYMERCEKKLKRTYRKRDDRNEDDNIMDFLTDIHFVGGMLYSLEKRVMHNPYDEFFYCFTYDGMMNHTKIMMDYREKGACHGDELGYLSSFNNAKMLKANLLDILMRDRMINLWTNFAKNGYPSPINDDVIYVDWLPAIDKELCNLEIGNELKMNYSLTPERMRMCRELYKHF